MDRIHAMRIAVEVAERNGFAGAARALHLSPPAVTRAVAALERTIGARLFVRTTRTVRLTEAGSRYVDDCRRILGELREAEAGAAGTHASPAGVLTVTAPALFGRLHVLPIVLAFLDAHPAIRIRTLFVDRLASLVDEDIDVAVRIAHLPDSGLSAVRVGSVRRVLCGAPAYFAVHGVPRVPSDLQRHAVIGREGVLGSNEWRFGRNAEVRVDVQPRLTCNTNDAAMAATLAGFGLSRFQSYQVAADVAAGRLRVVLAAHEEDPVPVHVVHVEGRRATARVRAFVDDCAAAFRDDAVLRTEPRSMGTRRGKR